VNGAELLHLSGLASFAVWGVLCSGNGCNVYTEDLLLSTAVAVGGGGGGGESSGGAQGYGGGTNALGGSTNSNQGGAVAVGGCSVGGGDCSAAGTVAQGGTLEGGTTGSAARGGAEAGATDSAGAGGMTGVGGTLSGGAGSSSAGSSVAAGRSGSGGIGTGGTRTGGTMNGGDAGMAGRSGGAGSGGVAGMVGGTSAVAGQAGTAGGSSCLTGQSLCSGICVDLMTDVKNCNGCGKICSSGLTCEAGSCVTAVIRDPCSDVTATGTPTLIDDLNDGNGLILRNDGRQGAWSTYNDGTGTQSPTASSATTCDPAYTFTPTEKRACTSGSGFTGWGAAIGLSLLMGTSCVSCNYNALAIRQLYLGIRFTVSVTSVTGKLRFDLSTANTQGQAWGGTCAVDSCLDAFGKEITATSQPQPVEVAWAELTHAGWGDKDIALDYRLLQVMRWTVVPQGGTPASFTNLCIDDVQFF
jgi:hypothetical protein